MGLSQTASLPRPPTVLRAFAREPFLVALLVSAAAHILLALALKLFPACSIEPPPVESIIVEFVSPAETEVARVGRETGEAPPIPPSPPALPPPADLLAAPEPMLHATRILSEASLADPQNRLARQALRTLAGDERMEQLCGIEAMDQVHAWRDAFEPDRLVAYAMAPTFVSGNAIKADGAAFRSNRRWYNLRFRCELTPDRRKVAAFEFLVGDPIPADVWEAHNLPPIE
jgi:hypothetical protein